MSGKRAKLLRRQNKGNGDGGGKGAGYVCKVVIDAYLDHITVKGPNDLLQTQSVLIEGLKAISEKQIKDRMAGEKRIVSPGPAIVSP